MIVVMTVLRLFSEFNLTFFESKVIGFRVCKDFELTD